jgi:transposase-like protein
VDAYDDPPEGATWISTPLEGPELVALKIDIGWLDDALLRDLGLMPRRWTDETVRAAVRALFMVGASCEAIEARFNLTTEQVRYLTRDVHELAVRALHAAGLDRQAIYDRLDVVPHRRIQEWTMGEQKNRGGAPRLPPETIAEIQRLYLEGENLRRIASTLGVAVGSVIRHVAALPGRRPHKGRKLGPRKPKPETAAAPCEGGPSC